MNDKLRIYYDAEFTGLRQCTTLISIGLVSGTGSTFYAEFTDYDKTQVDDWIQQNVIDKMFINKLNIDDVINTGAHKTHRNNIMIKGSSYEIKHALLKWLSDEYSYTGKQIQFYTDCYAYDWVLLNNLICEAGNALHLPNFIYYIPIDLSTILQYEDLDPDISREEFIGNKNINLLKSIYPFNVLGDNCKHNSLWDAYVINKCFDGFSKVNVKVNVKGIDAYVDFYNR